MPRPPTQESTSAKIPALGRSPLSSTPVSELTSISSSMGNVASEFCRHSSGLMFSLNECLGAMRIDTAARAQPQEALYDSLDSVEGHQRRNSWQTAVVEGGCLEGKGWTGSLLRSDCV